MLVNIWGWIPWACLLLQCWVCVCVRFPSIDDTHLVHVYPSSIIPVMGVRYEYKLI